MTNFLPICLSLLPAYLFLLQRTTHAMKIAKNLQRLKGAWAEHLNMMMGVVAVEGRRTIPSKQHSHELECVEARDIKEGFEVEMAEVVMTEELPVTVVMVSMVVDMKNETTINLTETNLGSMKFCKEMPSEGSVFEAAVRVEESKSGLSGLADVLPIVDSLDLVSRVQEEKQNMVSLNTTDCSPSGTTQVEEGLNMSGVGHLVEDHILEEERIVGDKMSVGHEIVTKLTNPMDQVENIEMFEVKISGHKGKVDRVGF